MRSPATITRWVLVLPVLWVTLLLAPLWWAPAGAPAHAATVEADDGRDEYVGSGGLLLPASVGQSTRQAVAQCQGCSWRLSSPCADAPLGNAFDAQPACLSVTRGCQAGSLRRTWFRPEAGAWRDLGLVCLRARPTTVRDVAQQVHERLVQGLPPLVPEHLPAHGIVTQLPTFFSSGQPAGPQRFRWGILGETVDVVASARWRWMFPGGAEQATTDPGQLTRSGTVNHVFRRPGHPIVDCTATWAAEFSVSGLGPFPVGEAIEQRASLPLSVGEGRALLTP